MIKMKANLLGELKNKGFTPKRLLDEKVLSAATLQKLRRREANLTLETVNSLCILLDCQPNDIFEVIATEAEKKRLFTDYWLKT